MTDNGEETERMASDTTDEREREARARVQAHRLLTKDMCLAFSHQPDPHHTRQCNNVHAALVAHAREVDALKADALEVIREGAARKRERDAAIAERDALKIEADRNSFHATRAERLAHSLQDEVAGLAAELLALRVEHGKCSANKETT